VLVGGQVAAGDVVVYLAEPSAAAAQGVGRSDAANILLRPRGARRAPVKPTTTTTPAGRPRELGAAPARPRTASRRPTLIARPTDACHTECAKSAARSV